MLISNQLADKLKTAEIQYIPNCFSSKIFSWEELERTLNLRPFVNADRLKIISQKGYSWKLQSWMSDPNTFPPTLLDEEIRKYTSYLSDATRLNATLNGIAKELEEIFIGGSADAHIYFHLAEELSGGFDIHFDHSHNFIIQTEGSSKVEIWNEKSYDEETRIISDLYKDPVIDVVLNPGDAVFVPMYTYHRVKSLEKRMSVSFPIAFNTDRANQDRHWIKLF